MAVVQLGGHPVYIQGGELGFDTRESVEDITRTLAGYYDLVGARVFDHATLERMEALQVIPIVNLL
jgi:ornithine carbamoyltransferase